MKPRLSSKLILVLTAVYCVILGMSSYLENSIILPEFMALENREAKAHLQRILLALENELEHLKILDQDWAQWDDTYAFVQDTSKAYIEANLVESTFVDTKLNLILIANTKANVVYESGYDLIARNRISVRAFSKRPLLEAHPELNTAKSHKDVAGLIQTDAGPMLIASFAILTSDNKGPARGSLVMGRLLNESYLENLQMQTQIPISISTLDSLNPTLRSRLYLLPKDKAFVLENLSAKKVRIVSLLRNISGVPILCLSSDMDRHILSQGLRAARYVQIFLAVAGALLVGVLFFLLKMLVTNPLEQLQRQVVSIAGSAEPPEFLPLKRNDEIGMLSNEFQHMLQRMEETKQRQIENSYYAGMSETASGIIHNVRNSLTSIVGSLDDTKIICGQAPAANIPRALNELRDPDLESGRRNDLVDFLRFSFNDMTTGIDQIANHTHQAGQLVHSIEQVLSNYLAISNKKPLLEKISLAEIINSVELLISKRFSMLMQLQRVGEFDSIFVYGLRVTLIQVTQNLLMNSIDAFERSGRKGYVEIKASRPKPGEAHVVVQFCDNGPGVGKENLGRLFERDFSTKTQGGRGLGLHWCANALAAIGGSIHASHNQPCGLCMTITLSAVPVDVPLHEQEETSVS